MKYVRFGSEFEPRIYMGNDTMHAELAKADAGHPVSAGHFEIKEGKVRVFGKSIGLNLKPEERDAEFISSILGLLQERT